MTYYSNMMSPDGGTIMYCFFILQINCVYFIMVRLFHNENHLHFLTCFYESNSLRMFGYFRHYSCNKSFLLFYQLQYNNDSISQHCAAHFGDFSYSVASYVMKFMLGKLKIVQERLKSGNQEKQRKLETNISESVSML